jgi:hypothetical protein
MLYTVFVVVVCIDVGGTDLVLRPLISLLGCRRLIDMLPLVFWCIPLDTSMDRPPGRLRAATDTCYFQETLRLPNGYFSVRDALDTIRVGGPGWLTSFSSRTSGMIDMPAEP